MGAGRYADLYFECTAPIAGQIANVPVNATAASLDLSTLGSTTLSMNNSDQTPQVGQPNLGGLINRMVRFTAVGCSVGVSFGASNAAVTGNNAPNTANTNVACIASACEPIPAGQFVDLFIHPDTRWLGYVAVSGSGSLVIRASSRGM